MRLTIKSRTNARKCEAKQARRRGEIPAVIYAPGKANELITINAAEFAAVLRNTVQGKLATTVFAIDGRKAIVKEIQYDPTSYRVIHIDFQEVTVDRPVQVKVPIYCIGGAESVGVKAGGFLRQVLRYVEVECPSDAILEEIQVNVKDLGIRQKKRLSDLPIPKNVRPLAKMDEVVVVIAKKQQA